MVAWLDNSRKHQTNGPVPFWFVPRASFDPAETIEHRSCDQDHPKRNANQSRDAANAVLDHVEGVDAVGGHRGKCWVANTDATLPIVTVVVDRHGAETGVAGCSRLCPQPVAFGFIIASLRNRITVGRGSGSKKVKRI